MGEKRLKDKSIGDLIKETLNEVGKKEERDKKIEDMSIGDLIKETLSEVGKKEKEEQKRKQEEIHDEKGFLDVEDLRLKSQMYAYFEPFRKDFDAEQDQKEEDAKEVFFAQEDIEKREKTIKRKGYMLFTEGVEFNKDFRHAPEFHSITNRTARLWNRTAFPARSKFFFHLDPKKLDYNMLAKAFFRSCIKDKFSGWLDFYENYKDYEEKYIEKLNKPSGRQNYYDAYNREGDPTPRYEEELDSIDKIYTKEFRALERKELKERSYEISKEKKSDLNDKDIDKNIVSRYLNYKNDFSKMMRVTEEYQALPAQTAQQTLKLHDQAWQNYWVLKKDFNLKRKKYGLYSEECPPRPGIPRYKDSDGEMVAIIPAAGMFQINNSNSYVRHFKNSIRITKYKSHFRATAEIKFPKKADLHPIRFRIPFLKTREEYNNFLSLNYVDQIKFLRNRIQQFRIVPKSWGYKAEMVYKVPLKEVNLEKKKTRFDPNRAAVIDLGVNIVAAIANSFGENPILIYGKRLKEINYYANRFYSNLKSIITLMKNEDNLTWKRIDEIINALPPDLKKIVKFKRRLIRKSSDMIKELKTLQREVAKKRYNRLENEFHRVANRIRDYLIQHRIGIVAIGRPKGWKKDIKKRVHKKALKKFNRKFQMIPFDNFLNKLWYKLTKEGIKVETGSEDYTSKCSSLDREKIEKHSKYLGYRAPSMKGRGKGGIGTKRYKARGLFKSKKYGYLHSDANGAFNIGRKLLPSYFSNIPRSDMQLSPVGRFKFDKTQYVVTPPNSP